MTLSGWLVDSSFLAGWPSVFYCFGAAGMVWSMCWCFVVHSHPEDHPDISPELLSRLEDNQHFINQAEVRCSNYFFCSSKEEFSRAIKLTNLIWKKRKSFSLKCTGVPKRLCCELNFWGVLILPSYSLSYLKKENRISQCFKVYQKKQMSKRRYWLTFALERWTEKCGK